MSLHAVLDALAGTDPVPMSELARRTGLARAAITTQVARARALGVRIESRRGVGYRLSAPLDLLDAVALRRALPAASRRLLAGLDVVPTIDSTNSELLRCAADGAPSGTVLLAEHQGAGRGRRGRAWQSPFGAQVCLSILWRFPRGTAALGGLSLAVGVAVQRAIAQLGSGATALKWPNDVVAGERKLAGVLVEAGGEPTGPCHAVVGVGLNARLTAAQGAAIDQPWTDLATLLGTAMPARTQVAATLVGALLPALEQFALEGLAPFLPEWRAHDALAGREVDLHEGPDQQTAMVLGIDAQGLLRVRDRAGRERALASAGFSVRPIPGD
jgi:BirA family biotin operon repressor/biotin-[acetyl-CoA-carboxylase] ligase